MFGHLPNVISRTVNPGQSYNCYPARTTPFRNLRPVIPSITRPPTTVHYVPHTLHCIHNCLIRRKRAYASITVGDACPTHSMGPFFTSAGIKNYCKFILRRVTISHRHTLTGTTVVRICANDVLRAIAASSIYSP